MAKIELNKSLEQMLISAERYACGRRTYIVDDTIRYITPLIPKLSAWCIDIMLFDMKTEFDMVERSGGKILLGDASDHKAWELFRLALEAEKIRRSKA